MQTVPVQIPQTRYSSHSSLRCRIVHAIPGRVRLRAEPRRLFTELAEAFTAALRTLPGIQQVHVTPSCRSVTLTYNIDLYRAETLLARLQTLSLDQLSPVPVASPPSPATNSLSLSWLRLGLSSTAVALGVLAESALTPWLVVGAAVPIFRRAYTALTQTGPLNADVLDAAATTVLILNGHAPTAALMVCLISLGDFLSDLSQQELQQTAKEYVSERVDATKASQPVGSVRPHETRLQQHAERLAERVAPWSLVGAGAALISGSAETAAALLIPDYSTGMRTTAPLTTLATMSSAAAQGIVIKQSHTLEQLAEVDTLVLQKTGVLTRGIPEVVEVIPYGKKTSPERVLAVAAAAEQQQPHPLAQTLVRAAHSRGIAIPEGEAAEYRAGLGIEAVVEGTVILVGSQQFMTQQRVPLQRARKGIRDIAEREASPIFVAVDGKLSGILAIVDPLRSEAQDIVPRLRQLGLREVVLVTGDHTVTAERLVQRLRFTRCLADVFPEQKIDFVRVLRQEGHRVAVVRYGQVPAPVAAQADVEITICDETTHRQESGQVLLLNGNVRQLPDTFQIAREGIARHRQNWDLLWYANTTALGLSLVGLIGPLGAILLSNGSALVATLNARRPLG